MVTEKHLDYLQLSTLLSEQKVQQNSKKEIHPIAFYKRGYMDEFGVRMYFGNPKSKKASVVFDGTALHNLRLIKYPLSTQLNTWIASGANISRTDWCVTQYTDEVDKNIVTVADIAEIFASNGFTGTLTKYGAKSITGFDLKRDNGDKIGVETFYIGDMKRRGKSGIFRAYDKGIELDDGYARDTITRIELEERQTNATNSMKRYLGGHDIGSIIRSRIDSDDTRWSKIIDAPAIDISRGKQWKEPTNDSEKHEKRKQWLLNQVAKSIAETVVHEPQFADILNNEIWKHIKEIT